MVLWSGGSVVDGSGFSVLVWSLRVEAKVGGSSELYRLPRLEVWVSSVRRLARSDLVIWLRKEI